MPWNFNEGRFTRVEPGTGRIIILEPQDQHVDVYVSRRDGSPQLLRVGHTRTLEEAKALAEDIAHSMEVRHG